MVKEMFYFLTLLSWHRQSMKRFIEIPNILKLCDSFIEAEQSASSGKLCITIYFNFVWAL